MQRCGQRIIRWSRTWRAEPPRQVLTVPLSCSVLLSTFPLSFTLRPKNLPLTSGVESLSRVQLFATPWTAAHQASLSFTISQSWCKLTSIELVMPSKHLILCHPLLSIRVFSSELALCIRWSKYWSFGFSISPSNENSGLISSRIDGFDLLAVIISSVDMIFF